jgi:hypothetical protein
MSPSDLVAPPPAPKVVDYPGMAGVGLGIVFTTILLIAAGKFDPSGGVLTISIMVVLSFFAVVAICIFYTIPTDEATSMVIGGLVAAFGAVVTHWLGRRKDGS